MGNSEAKELANSFELGALLCNECHTYVADKPEYRDKLFRILYKLWGYARIKQLHTQIDEALLTGVPFKLPAEE